MPIDKKVGPDDPIPVYMMPPMPGDEVTDRYEVFGPEYLQGLDLFRIVFQPPHAGATPAQAHAMRRDAEYYALVLSVLRKAARIAADSLGMAAECTRPGCRRAGRCMGRRHEFDWSFPGPWMVPCARTVRRIEAIRELVRKMGDASPAQAPHGTD